MNGFICAMVSSQAARWWIKTYVQTMSEIFGDLVGTRVHFLGRVDDAVKNFLITACDVLVAPSLYESFGLMYVEAMRAGKPVIGTKAGGIPEVVDDGKTGLLVPPSDVHARRGDASARCRRRFQALARRKRLTTFRAALQPLQFRRESENFYREVLDEWRGKGFSNETAELRIRVGRIPFQLHNPAFRTT